MIYLIGKLSFVLAKILIFFLQFNNFLPTNLYYLLMENAIATNKETIENYKRNLIV